MDEADRQRYETQSKDLRVKLKEWELEFAKSHGGAKPTRDDIKANPKIASYSKRYHKLRDVLSGKISHAQLDGDTQDRKRKPHALPSSSHTPSSKRFRPAETPSSRQQTQTTTLATPHGPPAASEAAAAAAVTPSLNRKLFSPAVPTSIGPTPQRDGRVLGLFDLLPFKDAEIDSPSRPKRTTKAPNAAEGIQETPRRGRTIDTGVGIPIDLDRTPSSRSMRQQQQQPQQHPQQTPRKSILSTPLKDSSNRVAKTPSSSRSVSKLQFQTPAFLRRIPMAKISENNEFPSPEPIRLPRKPLVRGLSSIVADLRRTQEEQLDDELDALREMEAEGQGEGPPANLAKKHSAAPPGEEQPTPAAQKHTARDDDDLLTEAILAEDSQKQNLGLLGGFDDEGMYDSGDGEQEGVDHRGMPLRVFKKKGQKRTTRKANMKPVMTRRPPAEGSAQREEDGEIIPETQLEKPASTHPGPEDDVDLLSGSDFAGSDYGEEDEEDELALDEPRLAKKAAAGTKKKAAPSSKQKQGGGDKPEGKVKKAARKVNELAHANFKRLKLRNSGAKGGQGFNSRFRRRR